MITDAKRFTHVVVGNQYPDIALFQEANDFLDFEYGNRVDPGERLVKENEAWDLMEKRAAKIAIRAFIEEKKLVPPGVNYGTKKDLNVRRPTSK